MATQYPLVQLVSAPEVDAEIRFDCNQDGLTWPAADGFTIGAPSLLGEPGIVGAEYGLRPVGFTLVVDAGESQARSIQSQLARELLRVDNWLRFQVSASAPPQWFRVYRSGPGAVSFATVYLGMETSQWLIDVSLVCDPWSLGERQTIGPLTITQNPVNSNAVAYALPDIKGDFPTPLVVDIAATPTSPQDVLRPAGVVAMSSLSRWDGLQFWQAETAMGGGTVASAAPYSGGQYRSIESVGFNDWTDAFWMDGTFAPPQAGRYRLFARLYSFSFTGTTQVRASGYALSDGTGTIELPNGYTDMADLGVYAFPWGHVPLDADYETAAPASTGGPYQVLIEAKKSGTADPGENINLAIDYIVAIPVALYESLGQTALHFKTSIEASNRRVVIDGEQEVMLFYGAGDTLVNASTGVQEASAAQSLRGAFPVVDPAAPHNVLHYVQQRGNGQNIWLGRTFTLTLSYRPRWLYVAAE